MSYTRQVLSGSSETLTRWINSIEDSDNREEVRGFYVSHKIVFLTPAGLGAANIIITVITGKLKYIDYVCKRIRECSH